MCLNAFCLPDIPLSPGEGDNGGEVQTRINLYMRDYKTYYI